MQLNPDILSSLSGLMVSQPLSQSVGCGFESQEKCWDFSSSKNRAISALIYTNTTSYCGHPEKQIQLHIPNCLGCLICKQQLVYGLFENMALTYDIIH